MARETKVGLLAGLAFIICFAVILANRGSNAPPGLTNSFLPNGGLDLPKLIQRQQATHDSTRMASRQPAPSTQPASPGVVDSQVPLRPGAALSSHVRDAAHQVPAAEGLTHPSPSITLADNTRAGDVTADVHRSLEDGVSSRHDTGMQIRPEAIPTMAATKSVANGQLFTGETENKVERPLQVERPDPPKSKSYTVQQGDTLSKIASIEYGTKSQSAVEAIFQANRHRLKDIDSIRIGMVLAIPTLEGANLPSSSRAGSALVEQRTGDANRQPAGAPETRTTLNDRTPAHKNSGAVADREKSQGFRWYQIQKNDGFASIAREQLGDARRWKELYELNKGKFPDPQRIREGVRIKIPMASLAEATKERRR